MIKRHPRCGIVTAVVTRVDQRSGGVDQPGVQKLKYSARGFRNRKRFRNAIYFHLGGLDLDPAGCRRLTPLSTRFPEDSHCCKG